MTWLIAGLAGLAGLFYGLWQRSRAKHLAAELSATKTALARRDALYLDGERRHEALIASLKAEVQRLEGMALANATPDELRARLTDLLRPPSTN